MNYDSDRVPCHTLTENLVYIDISNIYSTSIGQM